MSPPAGQSGSKQKLGGIEFAMWANEQAVIASACKYINPNQSGETCSPNQGYFCHNVETNLLKRTANRLNGFYMMIILVLNRLSRIYVESFAIVRLCTKFTFVQIFKLKHYFRIAGANFQ